MERDLGMARISRGFLVLYDLRSCSTKISPCASFSLGQFKVKEAEAEVEKQRKRADDLEEQLRVTRSSLQDKNELLSQRDKTIARLNGAFLPCPS